MIRFRLCTLDDTQLFFVLNIYIWWCFLMIKFRLCILENTVFSEYQKASKGHQSLTGDFINSGHVKVLPDFCTM